MTGHERLLEPLAIVTEALWYFAIASVLAASLVEGAGPSLWTLLAAAGGGFYLARLLGRLDLSPQLLRTTGAIASIVALYAVLRLQYVGDLRLWELSWTGEFGAHPSNAQRPLVMGSFLTVVLWLRWASRARDPLTFDSILHSFSVGFFALAMAGLVDAAGDLNSSLKEVALPFFALGLVTIAAFHLAETRPEASAPLSRPWAVALLATVGLLLALALLAMLGLLVALAASAWVAGGMDPEPVLLPIGQGLVWFLDRVLLVVLTPIGLLLEGLAWLLSQVARNDAIQRPEFAEQLRKVSEGNGENGSLPFSLLVLARVMAGVFLATLVAVLALVIFGRFVRQRDDRSEWRVSVWREGSLMGDLGDLLKGLLSPRRPRPPAPNLPPDVMAVRRLYLDVLRQAEAEGLKRPPAKTPLEFAPSLAEHFRSQLPQQVSHAFAGARYGLKALPPEELHRLRRQWKEAGK